MTIEVTSDKDVYRTADLALAAAIFVSFPLEAIDREKPRKAQFLFRRENGLDEFISAYWRGQLQVEPQSYFNALRVIKARLYGED